jgi:hypothetical protein
MAGFSEQRQQLRKSLVAAGLSPDAATQIANILGNSVQEMRHAGPVEIDNTPADLRMVTPEQRRLRFPNLDFRPGDPDHRPKRTADSEERREKEPEPNVVPILAPQQTNANFRVAPGSMTDVAGNGQAAQVNVRNVVAGRPPQGLPLTMLDSQANQFVGKAPRAQVGQNDGTARLDIQETGREVLWNLQMLNRSEYDVVTKVEFIDGKGLEVTYERIKAWDQQKERVDTIPVIPQTVVTEIVEDKKGLRGRRRIIPVFSSRGDSNTYFNTYRIGTFTGGWQSGTTKSITQVWPTSGLAVDVMNRTQEIANTAGTKYVLFAARTKDEVTPPPANPQDPAAQDTLRDDPHPIVSQPPAYNVNGELIEGAANGVREPEVTYYAIEIQPATECTAFTSLNGKTVDALTGYSAATPSALSYTTSSESATPCLKWRSHLVTVITNVALTAYGLEFSRKNLYVLAEGDPIANLIVPVDTCPPTSPGGGGGEGSP